MACNQNTSESVTESTFTNWAFSDDFEIVNKNGVLVVEIICKSCPRVSLNETKRSDLSEIKGSAQTALDRIVSVVSNIYSQTYSGEACWRQ